jgi:hypothetical protein
MVMVFGEITTKAKVDYEAVVRATCKEIGFTAEDVGLDAATCKVLVHIEEQSPDIGQGVHGMGTKTLEEIGAGDQGHMFGYATDEVRLEGREAGASGEKGAFCREEQRGVVDAFPLPRIPKPRHSPLDDDANNSIQQRQQRPTAHTPRRPRQKKKPLKRPPSSCR